MGGGDEEDMSGEIGLLNLRDGGKGLESNLKGPTLGQSSGSPAQPHSPSLTINGFSHTIFSVFGFPSRHLSVHPIRLRPQLIPVLAVNHHNP